MNKKPAKHPLFKLLILLLTIIVVGSIFGLLAYSVFEYKNSEENYESFLVCNKEKTKCELSEHVHADIRMKVCGQVVIFPKETGRTSLQHTHKEINKIHWHVSIAVDPATRQPLDKTPRMLQSFFEQMKYELPKSCPNNPNPKLSAAVNLKTVANILEYVWKDKDQIVIEYK